MKVKELIVLLKSFDPEMEVATASYEYGLIELQLVNEVKTVQMSPTRYNAARFRPARNLDRAKQINVLCCGPVDPSFIDKKLYG